MKRIHVVVLLMFVTLLLVFGLYYLAKPKTFDDYVVELRKTHEVRAGGDWNRISSLLTYSYDKCSDFNEFVSELEHWELMDNCSIVAHADYDNKVLWFQVPFPSRTLVYVYLR